MKKYTADTVIIGAGIAGITAAIELMNGGKSVILLDRDLEDQIGGLAKWSFGGMFFVNTQLQRRTGIKDSVDLALSDWNSTADFGAEDHIPKQWAEQFVNLCTDYVYKWLRKEYGIRFFPVIHWVERGIEKAGNSCPRFHIVWGTGKGLTDSLIEGMHGHPKRKSLLTQYFRHKAEDLIIEGGHVVGVMGIDEATGEPFQAIGEHTIVATGGIGGSVEKIRETWYKPWGDPPKQLLNGSHVYATGVLHDAVGQVNGSVTHLDWQWSYPAGIQHPKPKWENHGLSVLPPKSALWLNYRGERIGPEPLIAQYDTRWLIEQICKQEKKYSWQLLNLKIMTKELAVSGAEHNAAIRDKKVFKFIKGILFGNHELMHQMLNSPDFVTGNSLEELVENMNALEGNDDVQLSAVKDCVRRYDVNVERYRSSKGPHTNPDSQLDRIAELRQYRGDKSRTCNFQKILDKNAMPLVAIRERIIIRKSLGGIQTDLQCRVMSKPVNGQQEPIPGLYAIGEAAGFGGGGVHGKGSLEGTFLTGCVLTGRIVGKLIIDN